MIIEPVRIGDILWKSLDTVEFKKDIYPKLIESQWKYILGPTLVQHCKFKKLDKSVLFIQVNAADWLRELIELKSQLIDKINRYFNKQLISNIEFSAPAYARPKTRKRTQPNRKR